MKALPVSRLSLLLLLGASVPACSSSSPPGPNATTPIPVPVAVTHFDAAWKPATVVLDESVVADALMNPEAADGVYHFAPNADLAQKLTVGSYVVLSGVALVHVLAVDAEGAGFALHTEPAALADAAETAHLDFHFDDALPVFDDAPTELVDEPATTLSLHPLLAPGVAAGGGRNEWSFQGPLAGYTVGFKYARAPDSFSAQASVAKDLGAMKLRVATKGSVKKLSVSGKADVNAGETDFDLNVDRFELTFSISGGVVATDRSLQQMAIPLQARIPARLGPIPIYLGIGASIEIEMQPAAQSSVLFETTCRLVGHAGFSVAGRVPVPSGSIDSVECDGHPTSYLAPDRTFGMGLRVDFPKIALGVGLGSVPVTGPINNAVEGYVSMKHEVVGNVDVTHEAAGPYPVVTGTCYTLDANEGIFLGGSFKFFGYEGKKEEQLYGTNVLHKQVGAGKGCPAK